MSRKSDIETAWSIYVRECVNHPDCTPYEAALPAFRAAFNLGRASVLESMRKIRSYDSAEMTAKRLRSKVRKQGEQQ